MGLLVLQLKTTSSPCPSPNRPRKTDPGVGRIGKGFLVPVSYALGPPEEDPRNVQQEEEVQGRDDGDTLPLRSH